MFQVKEGQPIDLWCKSDDYWEWCDITHVPSDKSCEHVWQKTPANNVVEGKCDNFAGRVEYIGDKGSSAYKCGIRIKNITPEEAGQWRCDITSYYDGLNKWKSYQRDQSDTTASKTFEVEVTYDYAEDPIYAEDPVEEEGSQIPASPRSPPPQKHPLDFAKEGEFRCGVLEPSTDTYVVGGRRVRQSKHPWLASVICEECASANPWNHICGGSLITER